MLLVTGGQNLAQRPNRKEHLQGFGEQVDTVMNHMNHASFQVCQLESHVHAQ